MSFRYLTMPHLRRFRRKDDKDVLLLDGLPPSFVPSLVMPSVTASVSIIIRDASVTSGASISNMSQDVKGHLINASEDIEKTLTSGSPSWFRDMAPVRIPCHSWNDGGIFDWYGRQPHTTISKLELRKERDHFKHEYILIYLDSGWYHRIERRPIRGANTETISKEGCEAEDSLTPVSDEDLEIIRSEADAEITLEFHSNKPDLYNVIAIAVAIHLDPQTRNYTLQQYNCYFVARSIIALVTRHCILRAPLMTGLRWDRVIESAIFNYMFGGDWNKLATIMKGSISAVLENLLWDVIKTDAGTRIEVSRDWDRLREIARRVIHEEVNNDSATIVIPEVQKAVNEWVVDATQATLWRQNLDQRLSEQRRAEKFGTIAVEVLKVALKTELEMHLPGKMLKGLSEILPERLIHRISAATLANLPSELLARIPVRVLEKWPDDFIAKLPSDLCRKAPAELWQKLSIRVFSKFRDIMVLTLPDDLSIVPRRLLNISLHRMEDLLDRPKDHPDRILALNLLRCLPQEELIQLPPSYIHMRYSEAGGELDSSEEHQISEEKGPDEPVRIEPRYLTRIKKKWDEASTLGLLIRPAPMPILVRMLPLIMDLMPLSSLELIPTLPPGLIRNMPESMMQKLQRSTLERLPTSFMDRLPAEVLGKIPPDLINNIPEDLSDQIREVIQSNAFEGDELKQELLKIVRHVVSQSLVTTSGELPATVIQISVRTTSTKRTNGQLLKHEDLQECILNMTRMHSKMVAQVFLLGMGEEKVYSGLCTKMDEIWRVMRLHPSLPDRS